MAQQTALMELLDWVRAALPMELDYPRMIEEKIENLLPTEKEKIIEAYFEGFREGRGIDNIDISGKIFYEDTNAERYYNITYQPNGNHSPKET